MCSESWLKMGYTDAYPEYVEGQGRSDRAFMKSKGN